MKSRIADYFPPSKRTLSSLTHWHREPERSLPLSIGGLVLLGLGVYLAIAMYPELRRYLHVRQM